MNVEENIWVILCSSSRKVLDDKKENRTVRINVFPRRYFYSQKFGQISFKIQALFYSVKHRRYRMSLQNICCSSFLKIRLPKEIWEIWNDKNVKNHDLLIIQMWCIFGLELLRLWNESITIFTLLPSSRESEKVIMNNIDTYIGNNTNYFALFSQECTLVVTIETPLIKSW